MRWLLLIALAYLFWRLLRSLRGAGRTTAPPGITELLPCGRCGTYVEPHQLPAGLCEDCRAG